MTAATPLAQSRRCVTVTKSPGRSAKTVSGVASKTTGQAAFSTSLTRFSLTGVSGSRRTSCDGDAALANYGWRRTAPGSRAVIASREKRRPARVSVYFDRCSQ